MLGGAALPLLLIAIWVRTPALPSTAQADNRERANAAQGALRALSREIADTRTRLDEIANVALDAPRDPAEAFRYLRERATMRPIESGAEMRWPC